MTLTKESNMMVKKLFHILLIIAIISLLPVLQGCAKATFEISNLTISPQEVETGQSTIISVDIANTGGAEGTYAVILKIDSIQSDEKNVTVQAGATKQATFNITKEQEGSYSIDINGLTTILNVVKPPKPAEFVASDLTINPNEFTIDSKTTIQVTVTNIGELSGSYDVNLEIDDKVEATESITLAGGANQNVTFTISKSIAKTYTVNIGELSGTFVVKSKPTPPPVVTPSPAPAQPYFSRWLWGPVIWESEFQATPGITSTNVKGKEWKQEDGTAAFNYALYTMVLPPTEQDYYLWGKSGATADPPRQLVGPFRVRTTDLIQRINKQDVPLMGFFDSAGQSLTVGVGHFAKGEAFEYAAVNSDKTIVIFWKLIPAPIEIVQGMYRLWVELKSPDGKLFMAWGEGFEPNEEIDIVSTSDSEIVSGKQKADADGRVMVVLLPSVIGKTSGLASITLKGKAGEISLSYEWGPPAVAVQ
jgi:hypothetical protein